MEKIVSCSIFDAARSIFKKRRNQCAEVTLIHCSLDKCSLRNNGYCIHKHLFHNCPYGRTSINKGFTKRSTKYKKWIDDKKKEYDGIPNLSLSPSKLSFVGDYVYLPYAHMTMCKDVPFMRHTVGFSSGIPFIEKINWNIDTILKLLRFQPIAIMNRTIIHFYQKDVVPLFLQHLKEEHWAMFSKLIENHPEFDKVGTNIGRHAYIKTLTHPLTFKDSESSYAAMWQWNGEVLTSYSMEAYSSLGHIEAKNVKVVIEPKDNATVKVLSESWVNQHTKFKD